MDEDTDECVEDAFCHRPSGQSGVGVEAGAIFFGDDLVVVDDQEGAGAARFFWVWIGEGFGDDRA